MNVDFRGSEGRVSVSLDLNIHDVSHGDVVGQRGNDSIHGGSQELVNFVTHSVPDLGGDGSLEETHYPGEERVVEIQVEAVEVYTASLRGGGEFSVAGSDSSSSFNSQVGIQGHGSGSPPPGGLGGPSSGDCDVSISVPPFETHVRYDADLWFTQVQSSKSEVVGSEHVRVDVRETQFSNGHLLDNVDHVESHILAKVKCFLTEADPHAFLVGWCSTSYAKKGHSYPNHPVVCWK